MNKDKFEYQDREPVLIKYDCECGRCKQTFSDNRDFRHLHNIFRLDYGWALRDEFKIILKDCIQDVPGTVVASCRSALLVKKE